MAIHATGNFAAMLPGCTPFVPGYIFKNLADSAASRGDVDGQQFYEKQFQDTTQMQRERAKLSFQKTVRTPVPMALFDSTRTDLDQDESVKKFARIRRVFDAKHEMDFPGEDQLVRSDFEMPKPVGIANVDTLFQDMGAVLDFLKETFSIDSLDDQGMPVEAAVNVGEDFVNAFWHELRLFLGNGDGIIFGDFAEDKTVTGHEMFHGIVELVGGGLIYRGMSGALNEHMADALAIMAVQYMLGQTASPEAHWLIGDTVMLGENAAGKKHALRTFKADKAFENHEMLDEDDPQGKSMETYYRGPEDNYGVHLNSGIPNHALYLAATKIGENIWEIFGPIWLGALIKVDSMASFKDFAQATIEIAESLFPNRLEIRDALKEAWEKVRVLGNQTIEIEQVFEILPFHDPAEYNIDPDELMRVQEIADNHDEQLQRIDGFIRVSVGEKEGKPVILVMVDDYHGQKFDGQIEGCEVVILQEWEEFLENEAA